MYLGSVRFFCHNINQFFNSGFQGYTSANNATALSHELHCDSVVAACRDAFALTQSHPDRPLAAIYDLPRSAISGHLRSPQIGH